MSSLLEYSNSLVQKIEKNFRPIPEVDALVFMQSHEYLGERLFPWQRLVVKTFYGLWPIYPPDEEEEELLKILQFEWHLNLMDSVGEDINFLILVLGRRAGKSSLMSFIASYEMYSLICKDNPQAYYEIRERHPIHIMHVAAAGSQAEDVFTLTKNNIRKLDFFRNYIDFDKDSATELRLFTPFDLRKNEEIKYKNSLIPRGSGVMKESTLPGSLMVESVTTSAATSRGKAVKVLMLSEFAHFPRGQAANSTEMQLSENLRTDYAIWKALTPSVKDFKKDGRVLAESSPKEKAGEFYAQYSVGGGWEVEKQEAITRATGYQVIQLSSWQARPSFTYDDFASDFAKDPIGAGMEYGAHFGNPAGAAIDENWIVRVPQSQVYIYRKNYNLWKFVIALDPGGQAKKKKADTYAIAWGHTEGITKGDYSTEENAVYWIDGMHGFDAKIIPDGMGKYKVEAVDVNIVMNFLMELIDDLGRNFILEVVYDQFNSAAPIATLQSLGLPAVETFFTNQYKSAMYGNYLAKLSLGQIKSYGVDTEGYIARWTQEMKFLQRRTEGQYTFYSHPSSGAIQTDDFCDVTANLIHRLCLQITPTRQSVQAARRQGIAPIPIKKMLSPVSARSI